MKSKENILKKRTSMLEVFTAITITFIMLLVNGQNIKKFWEKEFKFLLLQIQQTLLHLFLHPNLGVDYPVFMELDMVFLSLILQYNNLNDQYYSCGDFNFMITRMFVILIRY